MINEIKQEELSQEPVAEASEDKPVEDNLMDTLEEEVETEAAAEEVTPTEVAPKPKKKKKGEEEDIVEEKTYTVPLAKALIMPPRKRSPRAMRMLKAYIIKHMKIPSRGEEEDEEPPALIITNEVNEYIWGKGVEKPPRKIRVRATKDSEGNVTVHLAE
ncbi:MAG: 50S ribosomal protein L31e [Candidatus Bathyarchaeota archaeon]|nr:50S ribosomal protein L31e [Candidatus Bathyarchaeota archaeon]